MNQKIAGINLFFSDGDSLFIDNSLFSNFYIANIDNEANEIPYEKLLKTNKLYANFFILKINHLINNFEGSDILKKAFQKKNLIEVEIMFNRKAISFHLASDADPFKKVSYNTYDQSFFEGEDLCLLICPYNLKYKNHLFA